jgi:hypothetical protein
MASSLWQVVLKTQQGTTWHGTVCLGICKHHLAQDNTALKTLLRGGGNRATQRNLISAEAGDCSLGVDEFVFWAAQARTASVSADSGRLRKPEAAIESSSTRSKATSKSALPLGNSSGRRVLGGGLLIPSTAGVSCERSSQTLVHASIGNSFGVRVCGGNWAASSSGRW